MRRAQLKVEPDRGRRLPGRADRLRLPRRRRHGRCQHQALAEPVQGRGRQPAQDRDARRSRARTSRCPRRDPRRLSPRASSRRPPQPVRKANAACSARSSSADDASYYIRMVGPDKTMKKLTLGFRRDAQDDQGRGLRQTAGRRVAAGSVRHPAAVRLDGAASSEERGPASRWRRGARQP